MSNKEYQTEPLGLTGNKEQFRQPTSIDKRITEYLSLPSEEQVQAWTKDEHCVYFPSIVKRLLSPEGLENYSSDTRAVFFSRAVTAFSTFALRGIYVMEYADKSGYFKNKQRARDAAGNFIVKKDVIPAYRYSFETESEIKRKPGGSVSHPIEESLIRAELGGTILLGLSLPDDEKAMANVVDMCENAPKRKEGSSLKDELLLLLLKSNVTRKWALDNKLDVAAGHQWDRRIAELYLNLPKHRINTEANHPLQIPRVLVGPDTSKQFSHETFLVFLDYALQFAQDLRLTNMRARDLTTFTLAVRSLPKEFVLQDEVQTYLRLIHEAINTKAQLKNEKDEYSPSARNLLTEFKTVRQFRWYTKGVKELLT